MADLITVAQFTDRTGRTLDATQTTQVDALITDASALVVDVVADDTTTDTWTTVTVPAAVVPVVVNMVRRALDNPHGYTAEGVGSYNYNGGKAEGIFATRQETQALRKAANRSNVSSLNLDSHFATRRYWLDWLEGAL